MEKRPEPKLLKYILERRVSSDTMLTLLDYLEGLTGKDRDLKEDQIIKLIDDYKTDEAVLKAAKEML